jgi:cytidylate kinase
MAPQERRRRKTIGPPLGGRSIQTLAIVSRDVVIVAIDGPSGVGKTSVAKRVAERLGLPYLETGAMYRAVAWKILETGTDSRDRQAVEALTAEIDLELADVSCGVAEVLLDGDPLPAGIRAPEVSEATSRVSSYPEVRHGMVRRQREFAERRGAVLEGRDIGTRVFPDTPHKFFLTAPLAVRVGRRLRQFAESGEQDLSREAIEAEVASRDLRDSQRAESPLSVDPSYTVIDTGGLTIEHVVDRIVGAVRLSG